MTHIDPRDQRRPEVDPAQSDGRDAGGRAPLPPLGDPRFDRDSGNRWMIIGGVAAALILVIVAVSMLSSSGVPTARAPEEQRPPVAQGSPGPVPPQTDPGTTGSVPPAQPVPVQPAPPQSAPPQAPDQRP